MLLPHFMSNKSPAILLMDVKPWQRRGNQHKVRPFKFVVTTGCKWQISQEHYVRRREAAGWRLLSCCNTKKALIKNLPRKLNHLSQGFWQQINICENEQLNLMPGAVICWVCKEKQVSLHPVLTVFTSTAKMACVSGPDSVNSNVKPGSKSV